MGRFSLWRMNWSHSQLTDWGLGQVAINKDATILDVGCGGGRTISKLAAIAAQGKVYGIDHSEESVAAAERTNAQSIKDGSVDIRLGSVSQLPFPDGMFDLITAVETHFWWSNLRSDMQEVFRVTKPGGRVILIAEIYKGADTLAAKYIEEHNLQTGMTLLTVDEHRELLEAPGFSQLEVVEKRDKGWICAKGRKP